MESQSRKGGLFFVALPWIVLIMVILIIVVAILAYVKTTSLIYSDKNRISSDALYTMLNSNDCTPLTKLPFKDVLAIGIGEGRRILVPPVNISYGGKEDMVDLESCLSSLRNRAIPATHNLFYVEADACKSTPTGKCFYSEVWSSGAISTSKDPLVVESDEYIVLPNGDIAKAVLKTSVA